MGNSCVKLLVGTFANGDPRHETQHWENLKIAHMREDQPVAQKPQRGRKPLNPKAPPFQPKVHSKPVDITPEKKETRTRTNDVPQKTEARTEKNDVPSRGGGGS